MAVSSSHAWRTEFGNLGKALSKARAAKLDPQTDPEPTSAIWSDHGYLEMLGPGKDYADYVEFMGRATGGIVGRWVGRRPPKRYIDALTKMGRLDP